MAIPANTPFLRSNQPAALTNPEVVGPLFSRVKQKSVAQQLMRAVPVGLNGITTPVMTGRATAAWTAEGAAKPVNSGNITMSTMIPKKISTILVVSEEITKVDEAGFIAEMQSQIAEAFAVAFDQAVFYGGGVFPTYVNQTTKQIVVPTSTSAQGGVYADLNLGLSKLVNDHKYLTGSAFDAIFEPILNASVDTNGRPLFVDVPVTGTSIDAGDPQALRRGTLLGRPAYVGQGVAPATPTDPEIYGFMGDWSQSVYGVAQQISFRVSTEASVALDAAAPTVLTSLWQKNLVGILAEAYFGVLINDPESFVRVEGATV